MSTTTKTSRSKPVTLAKSASGEPVPAKAAKAAKPATKTSEKIEKAAKPVAKAVVETPSASSPAAHATPDLSGSDFAFQAKWNELLKAQSDAALAWWQDAKDAKTLVDALAVNTRHTRLQFEIAAGQAREMAELVQKSIEGNAERLRALLAPLSPGR